MEENGDNYQPYRHFSRDGETQDSLSEPLSHNVHVFKKRWYVLFVFCLLAVEQSLLWNTWGPIMDSEEQVFFWSESRVGMFANAGNVAFCLSVFPVSWVLDVLGMRMASLVSSGLMLIGAAVRCITYNPTSLYWLSIVSAVLTGIASTVSNAGPALFSSLWFPANQRATSTALVTLFNYGGIAASFIIGPLIVKGSPNRNNITTSVSITSPLSNTSGLTLPSKTYVERGDIMKLLYIECGIAIAMFVLILAYFPNQPKLPPSVSAAKSRHNFRKGLLELSKNAQFWLLAFAYSLPVGIYGAWGTVINASLEPLGVSQITAGWIGFYSTLAGAIAGLFISRFSDIVSEHMRISLLVMYSVAAISMCWAALLCQGYINFSIVQLFSSVILAGIFINGTIPLFFELACELCYPVAEGVIGGYLTFVSNLSGVIFLSMLFIKIIGTAWMVWVVFGSVVVAFVLLLALRESYSRLHLDVPSRHLIGLPAHSETPVTFIQ